MRNCPRSLRNVFFSEKVDPSSSHKCDPSYLACCAGHDHLSRFPKHHALGIENRPNAKIVKLGSKPSMTDEEL